MVKYIEDVSWYKSKHRCKNCSKFAVWYYVPADVPDYYYCDGCVPRGCSCMTDDDGIDILDDQNRKQPCCEYDYDENGFVNE